MIILVTYKLCIIREYNSYLKLIVMHVFIIIIHVIENYNIFINSKPHILTCTPTLYVIYSNA